GDDRRREDPEANRRDYARAIPAAHDVRLEQIRRRRGERADRSEQVGLRKRLAIQLEAAIEHTADRLWSLRLLIHSAPPHGAVHRPDERPSSTFQPGSQAGKLGGRRRNNILRFETAPPS